MARLAAPLALTEVGWLTMSLVDTIVVGHLPDSAIAIGAVSVGTILFYAVGLFGSGIMLGLDTLVAQAHGAGRLEECHRALWNALYLALAVSPLMMGLILLSLPWLGSLGIESPVVEKAIPFVKALNWSTLPLALYFVLRRYLQSMGIVKPVVFALVSANLVNLLANWTFVYGHLGMPAFGVTGSGWSTCASRVYMVLVLAMAVAHYDRKRASGLWSVSRRLEMGRVLELLRVGLPAASQLLLEMSAFAAATFIIGRLGAVPLAGHQIALNIAGLTFMAPLGIGGAAAVRVGHSVGARDTPGALRAGWTALLLGTGFMTCMSLALFLFPEPIARMYSSQPEVVQAGSALLRVAAVFQLFDGLQTVATGALRGAGNTRTPMVVNFLAYWVVGVPLGSVLCFKMKLGAVGFWSGLCIAIVLMGCVLLRVWHKALWAVDSSGERVTAAR